MSSGEEFEVEQILDQRKRKGVLEYLVRWQGFNDLYDSWEPASALADCSNAIKVFLTKKKQARSKSRSRSRGRISKSRSRSRSRGRSTKPDTPVKRSRSRSAGRKTTKTTRQSTSSEVTVTKKEAASTAQEKSTKLKTSAVPDSQKASTSYKAVVSEKISARGGEILDRKTEVLQKSVETIKSVPVKATESTVMTTRSRLAVRQVENDQKTASKNVTSKTEEKVTWVWWFADHAVLILFIIVSVIALSFTIEGVSEVRDKLIPDLGVLRKRLGESYSHIVEDTSYVFNSIFNSIFGSPSSKEQTTAKQ